ncbi:LysM peptidoglycan-binding domain-containing protein [Thiothrix lacustris]|jgi:LysM repeat protein|uniref:LysM peptidoglycan-binding domain-containing protein n=1 Tax=Thiothrix lacustris TaxID=525917 RepID=A0ABY9MSV6_9GAMM|nr:LysM peptidoglycan-binding domain-containing protein [Thiothrix lacustris]WML91739.1 LysM peptidoglycan-binding domain-containing protein [Thiothrix lacustris]WMP16405.1 LysM peptidoglycan-binding domain-containing protein [Thiothrix lacustris]
MDRQLKVAAATSLLALTAAACAPSPYYAGYNGTNTQATTSGTIGNRSTAAVTHTHCGRTHSHALPAEGLAHQHGDGCVAGTGGAAVSNTNTSTYGYGGSYNAQPQAQPQQPVANSYGYNTSPVQPSYYDYTNPNNTYTASAPAPAPAAPSYNTGTNSGSYYTYSEPKTSTPSVAYNTASSTTTSTSTGYYTVQKGDTVFQVMRNTGVYWKDIIRLNNLEAPNYSISPGQRLQIK